MKIQVIERLKRAQLLAADVEERGPLADRMLFWLLKHPYQRGSDLAFVFQVHLSTIWRHLQSLLQAGLVEALTLASPAPYRPEAIYSLTSQGLEQIASLVGATDPMKLAQMWKVDEAALLRLLPRLQSYLPLQDVILGLIVDAPRMLAYPGGHPAAIRWHWQHDYLHGFEHKKRRVTFRANGAIVFRRRPLNEAVQKMETESWYCLLFLMDPGFHGSEDLRLMRERLEHLLQWRESSERWSFYRSFPPLLILAPTPHQRDLWVYSAQEAAAHLRIAPIKGVCAHLNEDSPWRFSWRNLDGSGITTLQSVLEPITFQAIPPGLLAPKQLAAPGAQTEQRARPIVTGLFENRSQQLELSDASLKTTANIALLSLRLCHRHSEVIRHLYALPLVTAQELAALLRRDEATQQRYLYDLFRFRCIETQETVKGKRLLLTEVGLRLMSLLLNIPLVHLAERDVVTGCWQQRGVKQILRTMEHTAGIYAFLAQLQQQAHAIGQEMLWWETTRSIRRYHAQGRWHNLMPDALLEYRTDETSVEAWLEWDTGSMHRRSLLAKFEAYAQYIRSQQYRHEHRTPPILLLVTPQTGRERMVRQLATSILGTLPLKIWTTNEPFLHVQGPLAAIWKPGEKGGDEVERSKWVI